MEALHYYSLHDEYQARNFCINLTKGSVLLGNNIVFGIKKKFNPTIYETPSK